MWRRAAAEPFTSLAEPRELDRERDFRAVRLLRRAVPLPVARRVRRFRRDPLPVDLRPSAFDIICA